jgi:hypothetical protein
VQLVKSTPRPITSLPSAFALRSAPRTA